MTIDSNQSVAVIGGGPAGLMAAEVIAAAGISVDLYDAMPSVGRKFLLAGIGGLNITHSENFEVFCRRYADRQGVLQGMLDNWTPDILRAWVHDLGVDTYVGSSGRVFPKEMKAAPLLRAWLRRLRADGVRIHTRHRWSGWNGAGDLAFESPAGGVTVRPRATVLALGGASWPQLGSDGAWLPCLAARCVDIAPLESANCGFQASWSDYLRDRFAGHPLKSVALAFTDMAGVTERRVGEMVISAHGVEGSLIYAFSRRLRETINAQGQATFFLDLVPGHDAQRVGAELAKPVGSRSLSAHLQTRLGIKGIKLALLHEVLGKAGMSDTRRLADAIKALPVTVTATRPIAEAISTAGGIRFDGLDGHLMLRAVPGVFACGEMLDWEAPTGGYLLTAVMATGRRAGEGVLAYLSGRDQPT